MTAAPVIQLDAVTRRFDRVTAVDALSLDLVEGEFFALLGPSGCGKTTLLRIVAGFETPDAGRVLLDGKDITSLRANRRPINLMFQSFALFPHMTVRGNIAYGLEMERLAKAEIDRRVAEMLEMVQLDELAGRKPEQLSGGQRQRVALARALIKRPRVLLLDEPLGALDKKLRQQMQIELKRLQHDLGLTFLVVTHDQDEALVMADRIALMKDGRVAQLDSPQALYERPNSRFVADFIGISNFIEGTLDADVLLVPGHGPMRTNWRGPAGADASLAVRPERLTLSSSTAIEGLNAIRGEITDISYHGQDLSVHVAVAGMARPLLVRIATDPGTTERFERGQAVWCNWDPEHGRLLTE